MIPVPLALKSCVCETIIYGSNPLSLPANTIPVPPIGTGFPPSHRTQVPLFAPGKVLAKGKKWSGTSDLRIRAVGALSECFFRLKDIYQPQGGESRPRLSARAHVVGSRVDCLGPRFGPHAVEPTVCQLPVEGSTVRPHSRNPWVRARLLGR